jgi:hypothetical protein
MKESMFEQNHEAVILRKKKSLREMKKKSNLRDQHTRVAFNICKMSSKVSNINKLGDNSTLFSLL